MVMPPPRFLVIGVGCVIKCSINTPTQLTIGTTPKDIQSLDPYFKGPSAFAPSIAHEIHGYKARHDPGPVTTTSNGIFANHSVKVGRDCAIRTYDPTKKVKLRTHTDVRYLELQDGVCYWLVPLKNIAKKKK